MKSGNAVVKERSLSPLRSSPPQSAGLLSSPAGESAPWAGMESGGRAGLQEEAAGGGAGGGGWLLVEARLQGGAPWGFTIQGGLESDEPLIISKVEEDGKADSLEQPLQVGDEIILINDVELSGYRQEAIALVKGSYKTLQLTVRREFDPGFIEVFVTSRPSIPVLPPPSTPPHSSPPPPPPPPPQQQQTPPSSHHNRRCSAGAVQLRIQNRRSEQKSRPHSWHSTKLGEGRLEVGPGAADLMSSAWHHSYQPSSSTTDLSGGFDSCTHLRRSPDQYSSRGSMESLDPPLSSQHHSGAPHHHHQSGTHPTYSSCNQLSSARSSNSIDHLHSKRDSAYSSFSTSSSIPEYLASNPSFSTERSYSLEAVSHRGGGSGEMQQTVYDAQQRLSQEHELSSASAALLRNSDSRGGEGASLGQNQDLQVGGVCYRGSSGSSSSSGSSNDGLPVSNRHSVGPIWGPAASCSSYECLRGAPAPPRRSDSYVAIRNHERPNSWSSLEHARSLRSLQKGSWHHSSGPVASAKGPYGAEGQLHTVIEKSPESSPTTKPRQGGGFPQLPVPARPASSSAGPPPTPQSGQFILPAGKYPVPQPEPHYAQMPGPRPGATGAYPALAKESSRQQQGGGGREEGAAEEPMHGRLSAAENGYQTNTSSSSYSSSSSASAQMRTQAHEAERPHLEDSKRPQNHQRAQSQRSQGSHPDRSPGSHSQVPQEQNLHNLHFQTNPGFPGLRPPPSQEPRDPCPPEQPRGDRSRSMNPTGIHSESAVSSRFTQAPAPATQLPAPPGAQPSDPSSRGEYTNWDQRDKDGEHPLTRLENALAEVQRCASPDSIFSASSQGDSNLGDGPSHSLSVLEKVNRFERQERAGKQRSYSTVSAHGTVNYLRMSERVRGPPCGADDLRNMLERSGSKVHRTMSYRGVSSEHIKYRNPADPSSALQRSRSSFHLKGYRERDGGEDVPARQDAQMMLGSMQDVSFNRDSLQDVQSKVLQPTSVKRSDLSSSISSSISSPPPSAPPSVFSFSSQQTASVLAKQQTQEKRGPKTMPKPQGVVITPQPPLTGTSPHTPKERHVVSPGTRGPSPPAIPGVPPVGPPARICGRKRLAADQKKRSYSEPENLNEVGVTDPETTALFRRGGETSVADRRKMFELVASGIKERAAQNAAARPDLRQIQQDALAEYVERKRAAKRDEGGQRRGSRPRSAYLQSENCNYAVSYCHSDTISLSSTSSQLSFQDSGTHRSSSTGERSHWSTLPPGADLHNLRSNLVHPRRMSSPSVPSGSPPEFRAGTLQDPTPESGPSRQTRPSGRDPEPGHHHPTAGPQPSPGLSRKLNGALQRARSDRHTGKSASAGDLLERSEQKLATPQHHRSHSSPIGEPLSQDLPPDDLRMFGGFMADTDRHFLDEDRSSDFEASESLVHLRRPQNGLNPTQPAGPSQDPGSSHTPATRRERPRLGDRQRASTSTLAASVGLPCPFSPSGAPDVGSAEWHASERLSQANLDAITFPGLLKAGTDDGAAGCRDNPLEDGQSVSDAAEDVQRGRAFGRDTSGGDLAGNAESVSPKRETPPVHFQPIAPASPTPPSHPSNQQRLSSLRISESSLLSPFDQHHTHLSLADVDEVFLQNPDPPSPPPPVQETGIVEEEFPPPPPPPPPPLELEHEAGQQAEERKSSLHPTPLSPPSSTFPPPVSDLLPSVKPPPSTVTSTTHTSAADDLTLQYRPVPKRERTPEELRVEVLARQLVLLDGSLAPLLETWGSRSIVELMEEIFLNSKPVEKSPWQRRRSSQVEDRIQDGDCDPAQDPVTEGRKETDLDLEDKDLNTKKVELCEALRRGVAALRQEKEALHEEQRRHQALGASVEALVQENLKSNERDKYSVFIGDLERIVNLLLSLCGRLLRIDRSLLALEREELREEDPAGERDALHHKRSLLLSQTDDARELKENLDRRQRVVHIILSGYLSEPQLQDYRHFVSTKPSLLIHQRHLDNLIRQGEEQLTRLAESLPQELVEAHGWLRASPFLSSSPAPFFSPYPPSVTHSIKSTAVTSL